MAQSDWEVVSPQASSDWEPVTAAAASDWEPVANSSEWETVTPQGPSTLSKIAQAVEMPMRGMRGVGVTAQRLVSGDTLGKALERGAAATTPQYESIPGEKIGAIGGDIIGAAPLFTALAAATPALGMGAVGAGALEGAVGGAASSAIAQKAKDDEISGKQVALGAALGGVLGGAAGKVSSVITNRGAARVAEAQAAKLEGEVATLQTLRERWQGLRAAAAQNAPDKGFTIGQAVSTGKNIQRIDEVIAQKTAEISKLRGEPVPVAPAEQAAQEPVAVQPQAEPQLSAKETPPAGPPPTLPVGDGGEVPNPVPIMQQAVKDTEKIVDAFKAKIPEIIETEPQRVIAYNRGRQITDTILDTIESGRVSPEEGARLFGLEYSPTETKQALMLRLRAASTLYGQGLNRLSQAAQEFMRVAGKDKELAAELQRLAGGPNKDVTMIGRLFRPIAAVGTDVIQTWRGFLTSQIGTTARNIMSQTGRYGIGIFDDAVNGAMRMALGKETPKAAMSNALEDVLSLFRRFTPEGRAKIQSVLDAFPVEKAALESTPLSDLILSANTAVGRVGAPIARTLNILNTVQEDFFRRLAFDARLRSNLTRLGVGIDDLSRLRPAAAKQVVNDAVQHALELTFAQNPEKGTAGKAVLDLWNKIPILNVMVNPFPRFWLNAMKFTREFGPWGIAFSKFDNPNPELVLRGASRAFTGSLMFSAALAMRYKDYAGERWYEVKPDPVKQPNRVVDIRNFNPFTVHVFLADFMKRYLDMKAGKRQDIGYEPADIANAVIALRRSDFAGVPILDNFVFSKNEITENPERMMQTLTKMMGDFVGGFGTPIKSFRDLFEGFNAEQPVMSTKQSPLMGPLVESMPGLRTEYLKPQPSLFREQDRVREEVGKKQIPGMSFRTKTDVEKELDRLDLKESDYTLKSSDADLNDSAAHWTGQFAPTVLRGLFAHPNYANMQRDRQKFLADTILKNVRVAAIDVAKGTNPDIAISQQLRQIAEKLPTTESRLIKDIALGMERERQKGRLP